MRIAPFHSVTVFGGSTIEALPYGLAAAVMAVESVDAIPPDLTVAALEARLDPSNRRAAS